MALLRAMLIVAATVCLLVVHAASPKHLIPSTAGVTSGHRIMPQSSVAAVAGLAPRCQTRHHPSRSLTFGKGLW